MYFIIKKFLFVLLLCVMREWSFFFFCSSFFHFCLCLKSVCSFLLKHPSFFFRKKQSHHSSHQKSLSLSSLSPLFLFERARALRE